MKYLMVFILGSVLLTSNMQAQTLDEARKLYLEGKYSESKPAFEKAVKSSPKNASYNQWYGTCLLETGELDAAEPYLEFAASKDIQGAYKSLGKLYFIQSRFEESAEAYQSYIDILVKKKQPQEIDQVKPLIEVAEKAARMQEHCEDIQIIDSLIVDKNNFLSFYSLSEESGMLQYKDDSKTVVMYENQLKDKRYFSKKNTNGFSQIYIQSKLLEDWSEELALTLPRDSAENDNYPYVLSDGVTVYYSSTGNGSIGGYDLFVTRYNINNDTYLAPEQLGMPFNSPANDYMMAIDEFNGIGYFATDRFQPEDKVIIYTFIPNSDKKIIENVDEDVLRSRAEIRSIKDSWKPGGNYSALLQQIREGNKNVKIQEKKDFNFVINDNIVYHSLNDFESDAAKDLFIQAQSMQQEMITLAKSLDNKRTDYSNMTSSKQQAITGSILTDEKRLEDLSENYKDIVVKVRNTEIKFLKQQK